MTNATNMKILFSLGIMIAITAAAKVPATDAKWPNTMWVFILGAAVSAVALIFWRKAVSGGKDRVNSAESQSDRRPVAEVVAAVESQLQAISPLLSAAQKPEALQKLDIVLETDLIPLSERQQDVINEYGMSKGAEILVALAFVERTVNRLWSSMADDCPEEANLVLPEALNALEEVKQNLG